MPETLDIQKVISTSTSSVSLDDLTKKGFKQVKVLNQAIITRLIGEAVDQVLSARSREIGKEEREKVIREARSQFETLAKRRLEKERGRIEELEASNQVLSVELDTFKKRLAASVEVQAERDQALARIAALEAEVARLRQELPQAQETLGRKDAEAVALRARGDALEAEGRKHEAEAAALRATVLENEKLLAGLRGQIAAKDQELERLGTAPREAPRGESMDALIAALGEKLKGSAGPAEMQRIMLSLDGLSRRMANLSGPAGGPVSGEDAELMKDFALDSLFATEKGGGVESNVAKVNVKQAKAGDVKGALARLKKLQKGGEEGDSTPPKGAR